VVRAVVVGHVTTLIGGCGRNDHSSLMTWSFYNPVMNTNEIVEAIEAEIQRLEEAKALLVEDSGRPGPRAATPRRKLSAAARRGSRRAQTARWAKVKKAKK
jgi:hypothetical protein